MGPVEGQVSCRKIHVQLKWNVLVWHIISKIECSKTKFNVLKWDALEQNFPNGMF